MHARVATWTPWATLLAGLLCGHALASNRKPPAGTRYLAYGVYDIPLVADLPAEYMVGMVSGVLEKKDLDSVMMVSPDGVRTPIWPRKHKRNIKTVSSAALEGLVDVLNREQAGVQADMLIRTKRGERVPVTVHWARNRHVTVEWGGTQPAKASTISTEAELEKRYGIQLEAEEGATWSGTELAYIEQAYGLLSPEELACVQEVPLVRAAAPPPRTSAHSVAAALYRLSALNKTQIEVFTLDVDDAHTAFMGSPARPIPFPVHVVLHELGHALADTSTRRGFAPVQQAQGEMVAIARANGTLDDKNSTASAPDDPEARAAFLQARSVLLDAGWTVESIAGFMKQRWETAGVVGRWAAKMGERWRPTAYGESTHIEGFAEHFALVHSDPLAMAWADRELADWFAEGAHLHCDPAALDPAKYLPAGE